MDELRVREFVDGDEAAFRRLNEEWITRYFKVEAKDEYAFAHPREVYLERGGRIFLTVRGASDAQEIVGCCALIAMGAGEFEVSKMAVTAAAQGLGVGRFQMDAVIAAAKAAGARRLYLETNHVLTAALRLYEAVGFTPVPKERVVPSPYARADVYLEMWL